MSYKYSKGSTVQGDIKAADDTQRDTLIDFGEDKIEFQTSGSVRFTINNEGVSVPDFNLGVGMGQGGCSDGGSTPAYSSGQTDPQYRIHVVGDINNGAAFATETYASSQGGPKFRFIKARGTPDSPSAVSANDEVGRLEFYAHTGSDTFKLSGMIAVFADADGDGKMSFRATHNGFDNEAFYLYDNRVYFVDQVRIGNVIAPTTNAGTNIGGTTARFQQIHGNEIIGHESVKVGNTTMHGQSGYGITVGIDYTPHTDTSGNPAQSSHMSAFTYASTNTATKNVAFNLIRTGSHTVGMGTYGTGNSNEKVVFYSQYNTANYEFRNNVGVEPMHIQSGSLLMNLDASGNLTTSGGITSGGAFKVQLDIVNSSPFTVTSAHHYLAVDSSAARTINLPNVSDSDAGRLLTILDAGGQANSNNITINAAAGEDISGNSNYTINTAGGVVTIVCVNGEGWMVVSKVT